MLPALIAAYERAAEQVRGLLLGIRNRGRLPQPWAEDPVSLQVADNYHNQAVEGHDSAYDALRLYERELVAIRDTLRRMETDYRRTEGENAELWGRL